MNNTINGYHILLTSHSGINQLDDISALSPCDVLLPWTYPGSYQKSEWFDVLNLSEVKLMTYTPDTGEVELENGTTLEYNNGTDSVGIVLKGLRKNFSCKVKLTLNDYTIEESNTSIIFQEGT